MKFFNVLFSIYLVALSCLPCADIDLNSAAYTRIDSALTIAVENHDKETDLCPPFCICNCCGTQILTYSPSIIFNFPVANQIIKIALPKYKSVFFSHFYGSIWQPPQIA